MKQYNLSDCIFHCLEWIFCLYSKVMVTEVIQRLDVDACTYIFKKNILASDLYDLIYVTAVA